MRQALRTVVGLTLAMAAGACGGSAPLGPPGGQTAALAIVDGDGQTFVAGAQLPQPVRVRATDGKGNAVAGATVVFAVAAGGGSVTPDSARTDAGGEASAFWTLGPAPGSNGLTIRAGGAPSVTATATAVAAPLYGVIQGRIAGGRTSSCAIATSDHPDQGGPLYCVGDNTHGQLGIGDLQRTISYTPVAVVGGSVYTAVSSSKGWDRTCALSAAGQVLCWGSPVPWTGGADSVPTEVRGTAGRAWTAVTIGSSFICALDATQQAWCWGEDHYGQLGDGANTPTDSAHAVAGGHAFTSIASGDNHTCALTSAGEAWCWGLNTAGQLGNGGVDSSTVPAQVKTVVRFVQLSSGGDATCGIDATGVAYCWGLNGWGQGGDGTTVSHATPSPVSGGLTFRMVTVGGVFTCGIAADGRAYCWGYDTAGELGDSVTDASPAEQLHPVPVLGGHVFQELTAGTQQACGRTPAGTLWCWGDNRDGQVGMGSGVLQASVPVTVVLPP